MKTPIELLTDLRACSESKDFVSAGNHTLESAWLACDNEAACDMSNRLDWIEEHARELTAKIVAEREKLLNSHSPNVKGSETPNHKPNQTT